MDDDRGFSWWRFVGGALFGVIVGYRNSASSALWWLAIPVLAIALGFWGWRHEDDSGNIAD